MIPSIISDFDDNNNSRKEPADEVVNNGHKIKLYPEFIHYYKKNCKQAEFINNNGKNQSNDYSEVRFFKIFDDMGEYFPKIKELSEIFGVKIKFYLINGKNSWESLNN